MDGIDEEKQVDELLDQAEAFERGGEPLEALARARLAGRVLAEGMARIDDATAEDLRARVDFAVRRHEALVLVWQRDNVARHESYLRRERSAIGAVDRGSEKGRGRRFRLRRRSGWGGLGTSRTT